MRKCEWLLKAMEELTHFGPPTSPPLSFVPPQQVKAYAVDSGGIARCLFRYTYVWLRGFEQFWFYPTFVGRNFVSGYRWTGYRWVYFGIDLRQIQSSIFYLSNTDCERIWMGKYKKIW